jgi:glycosyltransferase involved in cell wall biosynthesis
MARYLPKKVCLSVVLREHEPLSALFYERLTLESNLFKKAALCLRMYKKIIEEGRWYSRFDRIILFSEADKNQLAVLNKPEDAVVIPLSIDLKRYPILPPPVKSKSIILLGNFSHAPNIDAALYLCKDILPIIKNEFPDICVRLVGAYPPPKIQKLSQVIANVIVTGYVRDVSEYYRESSIVVVPLRFGTGMRYKIVEAFAFGRPVVSTSIGARGVAREDTIIIADTAKDFAKAVIRLFNDRKTCDTLVANGRMAVEQYYNLDCVVPQYEKIYSGLLS